MLYIVYAIHTRFEICYAGTRRREMRARLSTPIVRSNLRVDIFAQKKWQQNDSIQVSFKNFNAFNECKIAYFSQLL